MGDRFSALLVSLMTLQLMQVDRNPFGPCLSCFQKVNFSRLSWHLLISEPVDIIVVSMSYLHQWSIVTTLIFIVIVMSKKLKIFKKIWIYKSTFIKFPAFLHLTICEICPRWDFKGQGHYGTVKGQIKVNIITLHTNIPQLMSQPSTNFIRHAAFKIMPKQDFNYHPNARTNAY